ncbi:MAG: response regulator transcription factor [Clostridiales bacterium]|nr:response regulator transcription factor [Clostridiales bacterium]
MADRVLIVDDDPAICKLLEKVMRSNEMETETAHSGMEALSIISERAGTFAMILMDVALGDMEGFDVIQAMRKNGITTPVIIISGRSEDYDFLYGLSLGADDYITKPFRPHILAAKVKALIRRSKSFAKENERQLVCGDFTYEHDTMRFCKNGKELNLSAKESALLLLMIRHPQQVFTKDMLYEQVWGSSTAVDDNTIMVYINRLRGKIEDNARTPKHIITIRGVGYRFVP